MRTLLLPILFAFLVACGDSTDTAANAAIAPAVVPAVDESVTDEVLPDLTGDFVWAADYEKSSVVFKAEQEGNPFEGYFQSFEAAIRLDPDNLGNAEIHAVIDIGSVEANDGDRNAYLPGREWFNQREFPTARFVSKSISSSGEGQYEAQGELTIKGVSRPLTLPFTLEIDADSARAQGSFTIVRTEFNVGEGAYADERTAAHNVEVLLDIYATR